MALIKTLSPGGRFLRVLPMDIILTGSVAFDYLMTFPGKFREHILPDKLDTISLSFLVDSMIRRRGGIAPNIAYTLALLGGRPQILAAVGEDFGEYRTHLEKYGVDTGLMKVIPGVFTASFFANTDLENNQIASFYPGAMGYSAELSLHDLPAKPDLVTVSPSDPAAMEQVVEECVELGIPFLYDPSQQVVRFDGPVLRRGVETAEYLFVNEYEFELVQQRTGMAAAEIWETVPLTVVTLGEKGAAIHARGEVYPIEAVPPTGIADPTGVGDAFRGGFLAGLGRGWDWQTCGRMGALAAVYCLEQQGPQEHHFTPQEYVARYRAHFDDRGLLDELLIGLTHFGER